MTEPRIPYSQLIAFAAGELADEQAAQVEASLARHPEAVETVARYQMAQTTLQADDGADPPPEAVARAKAIFEARRDSAGEPSLGDRVGQLIARLIYDSRAEPALAGVRGAVTGFQLAYEMPESGAQLDLQADVDEGGADTRRWRLVGQVSSPEALPAPRVTLCRAGSLTPICTVDADERGVFVVRTEPGTYDLHIHLPGGVTTVPDIRMT
ncbi:MAG: anti-sigma factor family protein [Planctomycetota bacterium]|jgi:anti-sigma factor RsiW